MIKIEDISFGYTSGELVLDQLNTSFSKGEVTSILGRNGSGKSTLLKNINSILKPLSGRVFIDGRVSANMSGKEIAREVGFLSQRTGGIDANVADAVMTGRRPHINFSITDEDKEVTAKVVRQMGLEKLACRKTTEISGGELQKVVIARALVQEPKILLLDEPVNHLDIVNQHEVLRLIRDITLDKGLTTIVVMHDINTALRFSDKLMFLSGGEVSGICGAETITSDIIEAAFDMPVDIIYSDSRPIVVPL